MAAHLSITMENVSRSQWDLALAMSKDRETAWLSARTFCDHLKRTKVADLTAFERTFMRADKLHLQLIEFASAPWPKYLLWHNSGRWKDLVWFIAARWLSAPDAVIPCEKIHADWKWLMDWKRAVSFKALNGELKISMEIITRGSLPPPTELVRHVHDYRDELRALVERATTVEHVPDQLLANCGYT